MSALRVARYLLTKSSPGTDRAITHLKLQKLVYYAQAWHLVLREGRPLFHEEIEAWVHGPVCPVLYYEYRKYGYSEIPQERDIVFLPLDQIEIIDAIWEVYGSYSGRYLEQLTHQELPWKEAREALQENEPSNKVISHKSMAEYYSKLLVGGE
ncbi:type II toxin-antitoxin system antitoxin SocA domain-containing protein [Tumebacillus sp. BK434]|uniref:Panacea domain-containing protein n=1 Tax=Tumebacillus sp. BK434 TaxID=2512169 RepID=UPI001042ECB1|nr:type II toxin-antitoxin system antitoxin SocA domain-containing protein [Tumebacillus sp. BK434]